MDERRKIIENELNNCLLNLDQNPETEISFHFNQNKMYTNKKSSINLKNVFIRKTIELPVDDAYTINDNDRFYGDGLLDEGKQGFSNINDFLEKYGTETSNNLNLLNWAKTIKDKKFSCVNAR